MPPGNPAGYLRPQRRRAGPLASAATGRLNFRPAAPGPGRLSSRLGFGRGSVIPPGAAQQQMLSTGPAPAPAAPRPDFLEGGWGGVSARTVRRGEEAGLYDPTGSPHLKALLRRRAMGGADALRRRSTMLSSLVGLDPSQAAGAAVRGDMDADRLAADSILGAEWEGLSSNMPLYHQALMGGIGVANEDQLIQNRGAIDRMGIREQARQARRGSLAGYGGQVIGAATGGWLSPGGFWGRGQGQGR